MCVYGFKGCSNAHLRDSPSVGTLKAVASIYVEVPIRAPIDRIWELTQNPELHQRWDLRFTSIDYLPCEDGVAQRFLYETRFGLGLKISGTGESVGEVNKPDGTRTSALKFGSDDRLSLIREGSGYWQYEPVSEVVKFRTRYDYAVRYGFLGRALDFVFRPLIGWATAWSFDSLRLWAEKEISPEQSHAFGLIHLLSRSTLAFIWFFHGMVPKLLFPGTGEVGITVASGFPRALATQIDTIAGVAECGFALLLVVFWRSRFLLAVQVPVLLAMLVPIVLFQPAILAKPFQPVTLNLAMCALAGCGWIVSKELPSAGNCLRRPE